MLTEAMRYSFKSEVFDHGYALGVCIIVDRGPKAPIRRALKVPYMGRDKDALETQLEQKLISGNRRKIKRYERIAKVPRIV